MARSILGWYPAGILWPLSGYRTPSKLDAKARYQIPGFQMAHRNPMYLSQGLTTIHDGAFVHSWRSGKHRSRLNLCRCPTAGSKRYIQSPNTQGAEDWDYQTVWQANSGTCGKIRLETVPNALCLLTCGPTPHPLHMCSGSSYLLTTDTDGLAPSHCRSLVTIGNTFLVFRKIALQPFSFQFGGPRDSGHSRERILVLTRTRALHCISVCTLRV